MQINSLNTIWSKCCENWIQWLKNQEFRFPLCYSLNNMLIDTHTTLERSESAPSNDHFRYWNISWQIYPVFSWKNTEICWFPREATSLLRSNHFNSQTIHKTNTTKVVQLRLILRFNLKEYINKNCTQRRSANVNTSPCIFALYIAVYMYFVLNISL